MKNCISCGAVLSDEAAVCGACGVVQPAPAPVVQPAPVPVPPPYVPAPPPAIKAEEPISVGGWLWRDLLPCIPVVGGIIYFIMLWLWAADRTKEESFRNWAKSRLIWMAIAVGLSLLVLILMLILGFTLGDLASEMMYY